MSHVIRLIQGFDLRNPTRTLDLLSPDPTASATIFPAEEGFAPGPGAIQVQWSGRSGRYDGERRSSSSRNNMELSYKYILSGGSAAAVDELNRRIIAFFRDTQLFEEDRVGEPVWAQLCWDEGSVDIDTLAAPAVGQLFRYARILHGEVKSWPANVYKTGHLRAAKVLDIELNLVCEPHYYGLEEIAFTGTGQIALAAGGVTIGELLSSATQDQSATGATGAQDILGQIASQTFTAGVTGYLTYVRLWRGDTGTAAVSATLEIYLESNLSTPLISQNITFSGGYAIKTFYLSPAPAITSGTQYRMRILNASASMTLRTTPNTYAGGNALLGSTPQAFDFYFFTHVSSEQSVGYLRKQLGTQVAYPYTLMFWANPANASPEHGARRTLCQYYIDSNSYYEIYFDNNASLALQHVEGGSIILSGGNPASWPFHVALTFSNGPTINFYVNGALVSGQTGAFTALATGGQLYVGAQTNGAQLAFATFDGLRLFPGVALSATRINAIYSAELGIKQNGGKIGGPLFWSTAAGQNQVSNPGYGLLGGVSGDVEAMVEWRIAPSSAATDFATVWMGRRASASEFDPMDNMILFFDTTNAGQSGSVYTGAHTLDDAETVRGLVHLLLSLSCNGSVATLTPRWQSAATYEVEGEPISVANGATEVLKNLGNLVIDWPGNDVPAVVIQHALSIAGTATTYKGYSIVLPSPNLAVLPVGTTYSSNYVLVIGDRWAHIINTSTNTLIYSAELRGRAVTAEPGKYNYVIIAVGAEDAAFNDASVWSIEPRVTPRWLLPGGMAG